MSDEINELKRMANPAHEMVEQLKAMRFEIVENQHATHKLLNALCELKESQAERENELTELITDLTQSTKTSNKTGLMISLFIATLTSVGFATKVLSVGATGEEWIGIISTWLSTLVTMT